MAHLKCAFKMSKVPRKQRDVRRLLDFPLPICDETLEDDQLWMVGQAEGE